MANKPKKLTCRGAPASDRVERQTSAAGAVERRSVRAWLVIGNLALLSLGLQVLHPVGEVGTGREYGRTSGRAPSGPPTTAATRLVGDRNPIKGPRWIYAPHGLHQRSRFQRARRC
jgi:hypothetical protein